MLRKEKIREIIGLRHLKKANKSTDEKRKEIIIKTININTIEIKKSAN